MAKPIRCTLRVPIYNAEVRLVVAADLAAEFPRWQARFGQVGRLDQAAALCGSSGDGEFLLLFEEGYLTMDQLAHEVFHLTLAIMAWADTPVTGDGEESAALLHGYLMKQVHKRVAHVL